MTAQICVQISLVSGEAITFRLVIFSGTQFSDFSDCCCCCNIIVLFKKKNLKIVY